MTLDAHVSWKMHVDSFILSILSIFFVITKVGFVNIALKSQSCT
jgi:hypothetical protein